MDNINIYTDLALEERERFKRDVEIKGVAIEKYEDEKLAMTTTIVDILDRNGARAMGKPEGTYITMETRKLKEIDKKIREEIGCRLGNNLIDMAKHQKVKKILVVGLGNSRATPDALGPKTAEAINIGENVYCIAPGVLAQTGLETFTIIKGIVEQAEPDLLIVVDSLAARNVRRVTTTIQLTDTGIIPGSGIGNHRQALNEETLGVKVLAVGVPMVVSSATIVYDTMEKLLNIIKMSGREDTFTNIFEMYNESEKYQLLEELLSEDTEQMFVTPKDVDELVDNLSKILAFGINKFCSQVI